MLREKFASTNQENYPDLGSDTSLLWGGVTKCRLFWLVIGLYCVFHSHVSEDFLHPSSHFYLSKGSTCLWLLLAFKTKMLGQKKLRIKIVDR